MPKWTVLELLRSDPEKYKKMVIRRGKDPSLVTQFLELDREYKNRLKEIERIRSEMNKISAAVAQTEREDEKGRLLEQARVLKEHLSTEEKNFSEFETRWKAFLFKLPNVVADDVPDGVDETSNKPIRFYGVAKVWKGHLDAFKEQTEGFDVQYELVEEKPLGHAEILEDVLKLGDTNQAGVIAASRFYFLFDDIAWLDFAISLYALDFLASKGYTLTIPPYMVRQFVLMGAIDFDVFQEMIYKVENEDLCLIGTAEDPLLGLYINVPFTDSDLPIKLAGWSPCFRKEAGAHGKDTKGIFRVHQFHKVEQFIYSLPDESWKYFDELIANAEELWKGLGLPFRVVNVCAGELGSHAAKKYDIEVWYPAQGKYREVVSASNTLDWQAFRADITYIRKKDRRRVYPHTLNSTAIPTSRAITAILENYYDADERVVRIPKVLGKYLSSIEHAPKDVIYPRDKKLRK